MSINLEQLQKQSGLESYSDDPAIEGDEAIVRAVKFYNHLAQLDDGSFVISPQHYTTMKKGCSAELESLFNKAELTIEDRIAANNGLAASRIKASEIRACHATIVQAGVGKGTPDKPLGVAYTPIEAAENTKENNFHCDIIPKLGKPGKDQLSLRASAVRVDEVRYKREKEAAEEAISHGEVVALTDGR